MKQLHNLTLITFLVLTSCANLVSKFDQNSYISASNLKSESLQLISKANETSDSHLSEISDLQSKLSAQLAYEEGKGKPNRISAIQWKLLVSEDKDLLGRFLKEWKNGRQFSKPYIEEKGLQIGHAFDEVIKLESGKDNK